jgi:predicted CoA-substrate-specific enzyme activase
MYAAGIDIGSTETKAVILDKDGQVRGRGLVPTGGLLAQAGDEAFRQACDGAGLQPEMVDVVVGTGYGRYQVSIGHLQVTEISCHARGAHHLFPATRTVLDIGGQDTKAIRIGPEGQVLDFTMNDKCAAGTGRFLGAASFALDLPLGELGPRALRSTRPVKITTTCTVFAESEIINWLAKGKKPDDVLMGMHIAIADRSIGLLRRVGVEEEVTFTGGVSRNEAMVRMISERLGVPVNVSPDSQFMGALGAALFGLEKLASGDSLEWDGGGQKEVAAR